MFAKEKPQRGSATKSGLTINDTACLANYKLLINLLLYLQITGYV